MCPGIEIHGLKATMAPRRAPSDCPLLEGYQFFPNCLPKDHKMSANLSFENATKLLLDLVLENTTALKVKIGHLQRQQENIEESMALASCLVKGFEVHPLLATDYTFNPSVSLEKPQQEKMQAEGVEVVEKLESTLVEKLNLLVMSQRKMEPEDLSVVANLNNRTFILVDNQEIQKGLVQIGLINVASIEKFDLHLLRRPSTVKKFDTIEINPEDKKFSWVKKVQTKVLQESKDPLWLLTSESRKEGLLGMMKCLRREIGGEKIRCIVDPEKKVKKNSPFWQEIFEADLVYNIIGHDGLGTMRHLPLPVSELQPSEHAYLNVLTRGDLSSLTWLVSPPPTPHLNEETLSCSVNYAPLNFRDIMLASGKLPPDALPGNLAQKECILGLEFAGLCEGGNRVMGLIAAGGLASSVKADPHLTWQVPSDWSLKEAATVPVVYATAYYALVVRGGLEPGESVLIHAGSGGVGQAAIGIALARGCTVYTTVSSEKKRNYLKERFTQLSDKNFANSRDSTFEYHILQQTQGRGVDLVLNSLAGDLLQASVRCLKEHGRFLEIGKADLASNTALGMSIFLKNVTFHGILLDALFEGSVDRKQALQKVLYDGIASGEVKPLPATTYAYHEAEDAFRFMASGKHIGKVLLEISPETRPEEKSKAEDKKPKTRRKNTGSVPPEDFVLVPEASGIPSAFRLWPKPDMVYVITGGLGGLGLELADWLLLRGARKIVLTSRRGVATGYQALCVKRWRGTGASVRILQQDASTAEGAEKLLTESSTEGPIGGIFHLAMVLEDSILENQSAEKFQRVCKVKADGAVHLDVASRTLCPHLHLWVTFSSIACGKGNAGQSNYGWANSVSERVVEERVAAGLPGCAIQWGGIGDVGVLADTLGDVEVAGTKPQSLRSVLACLDDLIGSKIPVVSSLCLSSKKSSSRDGKGAKSLVASLANILGIRDVTKAPMNVSLGDLGMDSLMAVEIKQTLEREADVVLTAEQIRDLTIARIQEIEAQDQGASGASASDKTSALNFSWLDFPLVSKDAIRILNDSSSSSSSSSSSTAPPLFVASPIQGTCDVLSELSSHIHTRVIGLEYPPTLPSTDIIKLASALIERMEKELPSGPFHLGGYSYGASVAFEIAIQLEQRGRKPLSLILLDGSHSYVSGIIGTYKNKYNVSTFDKASSSQKEQEINALGESEALVTYTLQLCSVDALKLRGSLLKLASFADRLSCTAETILAHLEGKKTLTAHVTVEEIKRAASLFYDRLYASYHRKSVSSIGMTTLLVRAAQNTHLADFGTDYGLSKVINGTLTVKEAAGTHESFICGSNSTTVAQHINEFLSSRNTNQ
ncbi:UNVERIFIED_CONTAM: hypothetical protein GTU68_059005 [Idotea baltica]|nr:hypothetical protein [Idotea baltica]